MWHCSSGRSFQLLSPVLFAIYVDDLLLELEHCGVGCYCGCDFVGAVCYANDLALLVPSRSALRLMLSMCENFASQHGLLFHFPCPSRSAFRFDPLVRA